MNKEKLAMIWFETSLAHIRNCIKDDCDWANQFILFLYSHDVTCEQEEEWIEEAIQKGKQDETKSW